MTEEVIVKIDYLILGPYVTNTYIVHDPNTHEGVIIDPSFDPDSIIHAIDKLKVNVKGIFITHGHLDHMAGLNSVRAYCKDAKVYIDKRDKEYLSDPYKNLSYGFPDKVICQDADEWVKHGDIINIGPFEFHIINTSGHTPGGISIYMPKEKVVFTGDALFKETIGRTDFPGGNMEELLSNIKNNLFTLPDDVMVLSGHGEPTSIGHEKVMNPFLAGV